MSQQAYPWRLSVCLFVSPVSPPWHSILPHWSHTLKPAPGPLHMLFLLTCFPSGSALKQLHLLCQALSTTHLFPRSPSCPLRSLPPHFELFKKMSSNKIHQLLRVKQYNRSEASNLNLYRGQVWKPLGIGLNHSSSSIPLCDLRKVNQFL